MTQNPYGMPQRPGSANTTFSPGPQTSGQFSPGDVIADRYRIVSVVGRGGMGCVYKVVQILLKKEFALKTINPINTSDVTIQRLRKEAQAASRLEHKNLVRAVDFGMLNGVQPFLVMELVQGPTLEQYLKEHGRMSVEEALHTFIPLSLALTYAHGQGVVHRDLKPSNVILAEDEPGSGGYTPKICDFGIAKVQFADDSFMMLTSTGEIFGTPLYMSPEQCTGGVVDSRSDIYSLGCMLFEALTGAPPFRGRNPLEIMMQHGTAAIPSLKEVSLGESFPPALEKVLAKMLAKQPEARYANCEDVTADLVWMHRGDFKRVSTNTTEQLSSTPNSDASPPRSKKRLTTTATAFGLAGIIIGAALGYGAAVLQARAVLTPAPTAAKKTIREDLAWNSFVFPRTNEGGYFSKVQDGERIFRFPALATKPLGRISWWQSGRLSQVPMADVQTVPSNASLILNASSEMLSGPYYWACFHSNELCGVQTEEDATLVNDEALNQSMCAIAQFENLRILKIEHKMMSPTAFQRCGEVATLRWLDLWHTQVADADVNGETIAKLENLEKLKVLRMYKVVDVTPALRALSKNNCLRRLALAKDKITDEDIKLVGQLRLLEELSLRGSENLDGDLLFNELAKLPHLKGLVVEIPVLLATKPEILQKLSGLTIVVARNKSKPVDDNWKEVAQNLRRCNLVQDPDAANHDGNWFDPLKEDPAKLGIQ